MTIHRDTPPPALEGVTYTAIQTDDRQYVDKLDRQGKEVYVWRGSDDRVWVAYPEVEITKKEG